jgi:hypothetical protein
MSVVGTTLIFFFLQLVAWAAKVDMRIADAHVGELDVSQHGCDAAAQCRRSARLGADTRPPAAYLPVPDPTSPTRPRRREKAYYRATRNMAHEVPAPSKEEQPATHDLGLQVRAVDVNVAKAAEAPPV